MQHPVEFKKVREFGEIISDTFLFIKQNFKPLMKTYVYLCGFFLIGGLLSSIASNVKIFELIDPEREAQVGNMGYFRNLSINYILVLVFNVLGYSSFFTAVLGYIALYVRKGNVAPSVPEVWSYFKFYFFRVVGGGFLVAIFWMICMMLCLVPGIWVTPAMFIFFAIMIMENAGVGYSFNKCFKLVDNEWWITFATIIVIYVIYQGAVLFLQTPALILFWARDFTHIQHALGSGFAIILSVCQYLAQVFLIIPIVASAMIYFNLVERKESPGLLDRIDNFGQTPVQNQMAEEY